MDDPRYWNRLCEAIEKQARATSRAADAFERLASALEGLAVEAARTNDREGA